MSIFRSTVVKTKDRYDEALRACEIATQRVKCLNRRLEENPVKGEPLCQETRDRVKKYYNEHLKECEGIPAHMN